MNTHFCHVSAQRPLTVGVLGGGVAGATVALRLADLGINTQLFEASDGLLNGPPICHLHAGGNLYREISDQQCLTLLRQSIDSVRAYPHSINRRPTVIAIPVSDAGDANALLPRLKQVTQEYRRLVAEDPANKVLGEPDDYYRCYTREQFEALAKRPMPAKAQSHDDWLIPLAHHVEADKLKFPLILVQEYGWSLFRMAATATLALQDSPYCQLLLNTRATELLKQPDGWLISAATSAEGTEAARSYKVDFLINACGFRTGVVDDMAGYARKRLVEYKAAYVTHWHTSGNWPEVIFHGPRGTPKGMAQLTPYPNGVFQLHGMTESITLFKNGLAASSIHSAQPQLPLAYQTQLNHGWQDADIYARTQEAITHMARLLPAFADATVAGKPLFGAQQIPGSDPSLRAADVTFEGSHYARVEIVKASSALTAANRIVAQLASLGWLKWNCPELPPRLSPQLAITSQQSAKQVEATAVKLAKERGYPIALALNMG
ncbi:FAD-dependent oxidoreductase [Oceanisphaera pacifica]|uniref:FAD-dependent oxidoreductase n=1 Tax=Oceanisphaera pacifica TaxID=2818389 RepID=A0ABS3NEZ0_9GAMM|nr:FAD-dependent oxidoreductase [Oceanisphaera pacifica]MBO1519149.1 FAD-dependent oxidoreductase [Oceanisphaera pacifica]